MKFGGIPGRGRARAKVQRGKKGLLGRGVTWQEYEKMKEPSLGPTAGSLRALLKEAFGSHDGFVLPQYKRMESWGLELQGGVRISQEHPRASAQGEPAPH